jgi:alanine racemase
MHLEAKRSAWVEINLTHLDFNIKNILHKVGPSVEVMGIIKADAYGHGAVSVAEVLRQNGVKSFGVATLHEAISLREAGASETIVLLGLTPSEYADILVQYDLTPVVMSSENAKAFSDAAQAAGKIVEGYVAIDTGMGRIGYLADDLTALEDIKKINDLSHFQMKGIFSHFATADASDKSFSRLQESKFQSFTSAMKKTGITVPSMTLANSAAIMELPSTHLDTVRPGIILYGCYPSSEVDPNELEIKPVMSVKANISRLVRVPVGFSVGYGRKFIAQRESMIATLPLGYGDGYPRPYSAFGWVLVGGHVAPLAGNICMDQCMVDVTDVFGVKEGDEVILMGSDGIHTILADDIAKATGTINYEIVCAFGQRLPKVYVK